MIMSSLKKKENKSTKFLKRKAIILKANDGRYIAEHMRIIGFAIF